MASAGSSNANTRRSMSLLAAALVAGAFAASAASAGTIGISGGALVIGAEPADSDLVLVGGDFGAEFRLQVNPGAVFDIVTPGCSLIGAEFSCPLAGFTSLLVIGSSGDDVLAFSDTSVAAILAGGAGADVIFGTAATDLIYAGAGDDVVFAALADSVFSGPGGDLVLGASDLGDDDPRFDPLPRPEASVPAPGGLLLLAVGLGAAVLTRSRTQGGALRFC